MKRNLVNFTRGSQLLGHFGFMFAAGLRGPLITALVLTSWMTWWVLSAGLSDHETYLIGMRLYAMSYLFMEFDAAKDVALRTAFGGTVQFPIVLVEHYPPVARAWAHMWVLVEYALAWSAGLLVPAFIAFYWFAARFGKRAKERQHERGAMLATLPELVAEITDHNRTEARREWSAGLGWRWVLTRQSELDQAFPYRPSKLAEISYPWRLEQSHAMLIGTTGMGKTVALSDMIAQARMRGQRAVIFDLTGHFIEHFYDSARDVILNPLDARCPKWSVFDECRDEAEFTAAAEALVPHDGGGAEQFWVLAARLLFVEMCLKLRARGNATNESLAKELMTADLAQVHKLMRGTIADPLTAPEAARMAESIRAVFNANAKALKLLPREGKRFSMREWIEDEAGEGAGDGAAGKGGMVFISARYVDMSVCSQLLTVWLDLAMNSLMTLERTRDLRLWLFVDELGALHRLPALEKGLQTARNFGGAIVTGIHAYAKLKEVYGDNMAMTLSSLARTKLILGTADRDTATWCSDFIGHRQVRDMEEGYTYGYNNARDAVSLTSRKHIEPLLLPDQLMNLPRLTGYLKFPDGFPAAPIKLHPVTRAKRAEPFIRRAADRMPVTEVTEPDEAPPESLPQPRNDPPEHPTSNDDGAGRPIVPQQGELTLRLPEPDAGNHDERTRQADQSNADQMAAVAGGKAVKGTTEPAQKEPDTGVPASGPSESLGTSITVPLGTKSGSDGQEPDRPSGAGSSSSVNPRGLTEPPTKTLTPPPDPRKLMLEDGLPEQEPVPRDERSLGDFDLDI